MKLISNINWFIDMYYEWKRLNNRRRSIRYYRRHRKIKPEHTSILNIYKNALSAYLKRVYNFFAPLKTDNSLNDAFFKELETYRRLREHRRNQHDN